MRFSASSTLLLAGALAVLTPAASLANGRILILDPVGKIHIRVSGEENFEGDLPIATGRIELQEGAELDEYRSYYLTGLSLRFLDVMLSKDGGRDLAFKHVAMDMRDSLWGIARADSTPGNPFGAYKITFRRDAAVTFGSPTVRVAAIITANGDTQIIDLEDLVSQDITGRIDPIAGTLELEIHLRGPHAEAPWYAPWVDDLDSEFTITLTGTFGLGRTASTSRSKPGTTVELQSTPSSPQGPSPQGAGTPARPKTSTRLSSAVAPMLTSTAPAY